MTISRYHVTCGVTFPLAGSNIKILGARVERWTVQGWLGQIGIAHPQPQAKLG